MNFLKKIRNLPESRRKIILWAIVIIIGLSLLSWWVRNYQEKIKSFEMEEFKKELKLPSFEEIKILPEINEKEQ